MNIILNSKQLAVFLKVTTFSQVSVRNVMMSIPAISSRAETTNILNQLALRRLVMVSTFADSMYQITAYGKKYLNTLPVEVRNQEITSRPAVKRVQTLPAKAHVATKAPEKAIKVVKPNTSAEDQEMKGMFKANTAKDKAVDKAKVQTEQKTKIKAQQESDAKVKAQQEAEESKPLTDAEIEHKERLDAIRTKSLRDKAKRDKHIAKGKLKSKINESLSKLDKALSKPEVIIANSDLKSEVLEKLAKDMPSEIKLLLQDISKDINIASV